MTTRKPVSPLSFQPGIYRHYKGNLYVALHIARHHDNPEPERSRGTIVGYPGDHFVVYYCPEQKTLNVREWDTPGKDSWCDTVDRGNGVREKRFVYIGAAL